MEDILIEMSILKSKAFSSSLPKYKIKSMILAQGVNPPPPPPKKKGKFGLGNSSNFQANVAR